MTTNGDRPWNGALYSADCDPRVQQEVQDRLDQWYVRDGRYRPDHPNHATYTGLADKYASQESTDDN